MHSIHCVKIQHKPKRLFCVFLDSMPKACPRMQFDVNIDISTTSSSNIFIAFRWELCWCCCCFCCAACMCFYASMFSSLCIRYALHDIGTHCHTAMLPPFFFIAGNNKSVLVCGLAVSTARILGGSFCGLQRLFLTCYKIWEIHLSIRLRTIRNCLILGRLGMAEKAFRRSSVMVHCVHIIQTMTWRRLQNTRKHQK